MRPSPFVKHRIRTACLLLVTTALCILWSAQPPAARTPMFEGATLEPGLVFRLSPGQPEGGEKRLPAAVTTPLPRTELQALLRRLPPIRSDASDRQPFAMREGSQPAPRTAKTVSQAFPPPVHKPAPTPSSPTLMVLSAAPKGEIEMAPHVSVTFNQPMVPMSTLSQLESKDVPVRLSPQPPGKWRWLGSDTLMFVPTLRFPMATRYRVDIPAGIISASGVKLVQEQSFDFTTPALKLEEGYPRNGPQPLRPLLFLRFNQDIDPKAVLPFIKLSDGGHNTPLEMARPQRVADDVAVQKKIAAAGKQRYVVLEPQADLRPNQSYSVIVESGAPSVEGPLTTSASQQYSFYTYPPLQVSGKSDNVPPRSAWGIRFNNPLEAARFHPEELKIQPPLPGLQAEVYGNSLRVRGRSKGRTLYSLTLPASLTDQFGQTLGKPEVVPIQVGDARPMFSGPAQPFTVLDPQGPRAVVCSLVNYPRLKVRAWKVQPRDWQTFIKYLQDFRRNPKDLKAPGQLVVDREMETGAPLDELAEVPVDLSPCLEEGLGQVVVQIEPSPQDETRSGRQVYVGWVQSTHIGLDAMADNRQLVAWGNDLASGKPLAGLELSLQGDPKAVGTTGPDGLARLPLGATSDLLVARQGRDLAILPREFSYWYTYGWTPYDPGNRNPWYVADDRHLYRPGEKVSLKGWLRTAVYGPQGDLSGTSVHQIDYRLLDSRGNEVCKGKTTVGALGGFHLELELPKTLNLGQQKLELRADNGQAFNHLFQVEEFRRPEFEVTASSTPASVLVGEHSLVTATAAYFAGGALANAQVDWSVTASPTVYSPPHWPEYSFGTWTPWWNCRRWWLESASPEPRAFEKLQTRSDAGGKSLVRVDFQSVDPPRPTSVVARATVQDVNRQAWSTQSTILVHPASLYVGLKSRRAFVEKGQSLELSAIVTDLEGKAVVGKTIQIKAYRLDWESSRGELKVKHADSSSQEVVSQAQPVSFKVATGEGGTYQVQAFIQDDHNRRNRSEMTMWVAGGPQPPSRRIEQESITLVPSKKEYEPGETAEVLVQTPFAPAEVVVSTRRNGLAEVKRLTLKSGSTTLQFPLQELFIPGLTVQVDAVGQKLRTDPAGPMRPAYASGSLTLNISKRSRQLQVAVKPAAPSLQPGASTSVQVALKDSGGRPVRGEVCLVMVDESVLALTGYDPADPLASFCQLRPSDVIDSHLRKFVSLSQNPDDASGQGENRRRAAQKLKKDVGGDDEFASKTEGGGYKDKMVPLGDAATGRAAHKSPAPATTPTSIFKVRSNFAPLALFAPTVNTDAEGRATVNLKLPDNLTRYRIVALAAAGDKQFGKGEASLLARQPLMIRPSAPRFLNFGDRCQLPVVVQNQTDQAMSVAIGCRASNAKLETAGYRVRVPANGRVEVRFPAATTHPGTARFQFGANCADYNDAAEVSLPVWTPATTEAFASYGVLDEGAIAQPVEKPSHVIPDFGGLSVTTSSTALSELSDAYLYLCSYPFECSEQVASRMLAAAALKDVMQAFQAPGIPDKAHLDEAMRRDLLRLKGQQNHDGGWDYWTREKPSVPFLTVHVAHTLVRVKAKSFQVDDRMLEQALAYLRDIERHLPSQYAESTRRCIRAYALYVLNLAGQPDAAKARALIQPGLSQLSVEAMAWLLPTLAKDPQSSAAVAEIHAYFDNHLTQTASTAQFVASYRDQDYLVLHSDRRDDGVILGALIETRPASPIIPKLVRGLLDHRRAGRWANTQENCWILLALDAYFQKFEAVSPDFLAQIWLGQGFAGEQKFRGRDKNQNRLDIPMAQLASPLVLAKTGPGRLYYRIGLQYAPQDLQLAAADYGFTVGRTYQAVQDNRDVRRDTDGTWHIRAGAEVKVTLTMRAPSRRYHVALVDALPAGFEALNPALPGGGPALRSSHGRWNYAWYEHQNMRDERVEAFTQLLWEGVHTYSYVARATTPGSFVAPPAKAEEMYHPETFGRTASDRVLIEESRGK